MATPELIDAALEWAEAGVPVFPTNKDKRPITANGHLDASTDPGSIRAMFAKSGAYGIGGAMGRESGLFAIDSDHYKEGEAGEAAKRFIAELESKGLLPQTRVHQTQSGGTHYLFKSNRDWPNCKPSLGVEVKGEGGYIILPPTPGYTTVTEGLATAPKGLLARLAEGRAVASATADNTLKQRILSGEDFHDALTLLAARAATAGEPPERVQERLLDLLGASVARDPSHPRHGRWESLIKDKSGELSRIVFSAETKFNPDTAAQSLREAAGGRFGQMIPQPPAFFDIPEDKKNKTETFDDDSWPFEGTRGYFGSSNLDDVLDQKFVVYPILTENETTLISAEPKAGKTLVSQTLAMHIAAGIDLGKLKVHERRPVIYFALESQVAIKKRMAAWKKTHDPENTIFTEANFQIYVSEMPVNLLQEATRKSLAARIAAADRWYQKEGAAPTGAIIFDTMTKAMPGGDQNSVEDTSAMFEIVQEIRSVGVSAPIVFIHHNRKDSAAPRGSSNIQAEPDTLLTLAKDDTGQLRLKVYMARSIEDDQDFLFDVRSVDLGETTQGFRIEAPVLLPTLTDIATTQASEELRIEMAYREMFVKLIALGPGEHPAKLVHAYLRTELDDSLYGRIRGAFASSPEYCDFITTIIPKTGRICNGHVIQPTTKLAKSGHPVLVNVTVKKLAA